jgi:hypothetical protein
MTTRIKDIYKAFLKLQGEVIKTKTFDTRNINEYLIDVEHDVYIIIHHTKAKHTIEIVDMCYDFGKKYD